MFYTVPVTTQWNIFTYHSFPVSTMEVIASLIFIKNFLCAKSDTLFISTSLPLYHSLIQRRFAFPLKIPPSLFFIYLFIIITVIITIAYYYYYFYYQYRCYFYHHCYLNLSINNYLIVLLFNSLLLLLLLLLLLVLSFIIIIIWFIILFLHGMLVKCRVYNRTINTMTRKHLFDCHGMEGLV